MASLTFSTPPVAEEFKGILDFGIQYRHIKSSTQEGVLVLTLTTAQLLDDVLADGLLQELVMATARVGATRVVLDMRGVKAVCSAAIDQIGAFHQMLREKGGRLVLCGLSAPIAEMFHLVACGEPDAAASEGLATSTDVPAAISCLK